LNKRIKLYYNYYKHGRKSGTAMAGPAVPPTTALHSFSNNYPTALYHCIKDCNSQTRSRRRTINHLPPIYLIDKNNCDSTYAWMYSLSRSNSTGILIARKTDRKRCWWI